MEAALQAVQEVSAGPRGGGEGSKERYGWKKLLQGVPTFKHYRRRKTNKAPRKRTFIMHMTKTPQLLSRTLGVQRAAGGGGGGGKKRHRTGLTGGESVFSGGPTSGVADAFVEGSSEAAFPNFESHSVGHAAAGPGVSSSVTTSPHSRSPFGVFAAAQAVAAELTLSVQNPSPFASAFALLPADCVPPAVDPLSDNFVVPNKYGNSELTNIVNTASALSFSEDLDEEPPFKRARSASPQAASSDSSNSVGPSVEYERVIASGAYGRVWHGSMDGAAVAIKVPHALFSRCTSSVSSLGLSESSSNATSRPARQMSFDASPAMPAAPALPEPLQSPLRGALAASLNDMAADEDGLSQADIITSFLNEVNALQEAGPHPNIVQVLAAKLHGEDPHLVLELAPWGSLADYLLDAAMPATAPNGSLDWSALELLVLERVAAEQGTDTAAMLAAAERALSVAQELPLPLTPRKYLVALALLAQAARGTAHLHAAGFVHRDLKPENVLIAADGTARVADLGLVRRISGAAPDLARTTSSSSAIAAAALGPVQAAEAAGIVLAATPNYASPEDMRGEEISDRSDTYSLGYCLWQLLSGAVPWDGLLPATVMYRVCHQHAAPDVPESWPAGVRALVRSAWQRQPALRPSAQEFAAALDAEIARVASA